MYSPKISEDLIPVLYRTAKAMKMPMTRLVDRMIREGLQQQPGPAILHAREAMPAVQRYQASH